MSEVIFSWRYAALLWDYYEISKKSERNLKKVDQRFQAF